MNPGNKILGKHIRQFLHKSVTRKFDVLLVQNSVVVVQNNGKGKTKMRAARANLLFARILVYRRCCNWELIFFILTGTLSSYQQGG